MAALVYPGMTLLDFAGPQAALNMMGGTYIVWRSLEPIETDSGVTIVSNTTFDECRATWTSCSCRAASAPPRPSRMKRRCVYCARSARAKYVTSVCWGSIVLAAAGLMDGYEATTHWASLYILEAIGIDVERSRIVVDRNRWSGGGVTAGIDFGLTLLAHLRGEDVAKMTQLAMEYDPAPPFDAGHPDSVSPEMAAAVAGQITALNERILASALAARARLTDPA